MRAASFFAGMALVGLTGYTAVQLGGADERERICRHGAAEAGRPSPDAWLKLRQEVFARAGVNFAAHHAEYEVDHIVPRCLDGSNDLSNLQLQKWPEARVKDQFEAEACRAYCKGQLSLEEARAIFRRKQ